MDQSLKHVHKSIPNSFTKVKKKHRLHKSLHHLNKPVDSIGLYILSRPVPTSMSQTSSSFFYTGQSHHRLYKSTFMQIIPSIACINHDHHGLQRHVPASFTFVYKYVSGSFTQAILNFVYKGHSKHHSHNKCLKIRIPQRNSEVINRRWATDNKMVQRNRTTGRKNNDVQTTKKKTNKKTTQISLIIDGESRCFGRVAVPFHLLKPR